MTGGSVSDRIQLGDIEEAFPNEKESTQMKPGPKRRRGFLLFVGVLTLTTVLLEGILIGLCLASHSSNEPSSKIPVLMKKPRVLLVSIDGFRFDYIMRGQTPNLAQLATDGYISRLAPQFPSYTFPNHFSIVTGLYPESHGIVSNAFFDPHSEKYFYFTNSTSTMRSEFWNAQPIWNTNQDQGGKSAVLHWPGSDVEIGGKRPSLYKDFTDDITSRERVDILLDWIDKDKDINFAALYLTDVDHAGHLHGPNSVELKRSLKLVDKAIGDLITGLKSRNLYDQFHVVIVSDHGMIEAKTEKKIHLDKIVPSLNEMIQWVDYGPVTLIIPKDNCKARLYRRLKKAIEVHNLPIDLYTKATMPLSYHYSDNPRIPPIVLEARKGWSIDHSQSKITLKGLHGYGRNVPEMNGLFIASGPKFRSNPIPSYPFHSNLDVYPLLCQLLGIEARPNNGTMVLSGHSMNNI